MHARGSNTAGKQTLPRKQCVIIRPALVAAAAVLTLIPRVSAEPVVDRALSQLSAAPGKACSVVTVGFNLRIRYAGHFPQTSGEELRITVQPIDNTQMALLKSLRREALRPPLLPQAAVKMVDLETDQPGGPILRLQFDRPVRFEVAQGADFQSIAIAIAPAGAARVCTPQLPGGPGGSGWNTAVHFDRETAPGADPARGSATATGRGAGAASAKDQATAAARMQEARAALRKHDYEAAAGLFRKVLALPETEVSAEAQELLALSYQKSNRLAEARAELDDYLLRYPSSEAADRVRQRRDAILTRDAAAGERLRKPRASRADDGTTTWTVSGSASQFYIRDDSYRTLRDPSLPPNPNEDADAHRVHQNTLLTGLDLTATMSNADMKAKFRFSGTEEVRLAQDREITSVAALFLDVSLREHALDTRIGRQTRNTGGVQGRFDGAVVSYQAAPWMRLNAVGGSPVTSRYDEPFKDDRILYGGSADFGPFAGLDMSVFAIEQRARSLVDRRGVGAELRYIDSMRSAFATVDYDVYYNELNAAILSGSWTFADKSNIHGGLDYRKSPYLSAWTALQSQPFLTLYDMLKLHTKEEIDQLARDRTPTYRAANIGYALPLNANLQATFDFTAAETTGTPASGGVPELPGTGWEYYYSAQLIAQNLLSEGDLYIAGVRVADRTDSDLYVLDLSARYPLVESLRVNPRLQLGYRQGDAIQLTEYTIMPSVLFNYIWSTDLSLELETGVRWTETHQGTATETNTEVFVTAGVRYDFYADGRTTCAMRFGACPAKP